MGGIAEIIDELVPEPSDGPIEFVADRVAVDMPVEVRPRRDPDGRLRLDASPPTQAFRTSIMPVFHRISVRVQLAPDEAAPR